jgi:hypothetical protein
MWKFLSPTLLHAAMTGLMDSAGDGTGDGGAGGTGGKGEGDGGKGSKDEHIDPLTTDIKAAIEKARQQEKSKLYSQIEETKKAAKIAEDLAAARAAELETMKKQIADLQKKPAGEGEKGGDGEKGGEGEKKPALSEELLNKAIDAAVLATSKKFEEAMAAANARVAELEQQSKAKDIGAFRDQLISANKDYIVPELVTGSTREELEQSLVLAKQVFARVTQGMKKKDDGDGTAPAPRTIQIPPTPPINDQGAPGAPRAVDVKQLSSADYAKNRAELLKAAAAQARQSLAES